jgi:hypothetical protein
MKRLSGNLVEHLHETFILPLMSISIDSDLHSFVIKQNAWIFERSRLISEHKNEYLKFISDLSEKYSATVADIESVDVKLDLADRLALNSMYRKQESVYYEVYKRDTSFCLDIVKRRDELSEALESLSS